MAVKRSQSAARVLKVLEEIAQLQPVGLGELADRMEIDKSALQRDIMTLADGGWIRSASERPKRWELTAHILTVAQRAYSGNDLKRRSRATLEALNRDCGETVLLIVPHNKQFVVIDMVESRHVLRSAPHIGMIVPSVGSATSRALLPYMSKEEQIDMIGVKPDNKMRKHFDDTLTLGYAISVGDVFAGSTNIAAPIFDASSKPVAAILVSAPNERIKPKQHADIGARVLMAARQLSYAAPPTNQIEY